MLISNGTPCTISHRQRIGPIYVRHRALAVLATAFLFTLLNAAKSASFRGLGDLPGGSSHSFALGVADRGQVVVGVGTSSAGQEAFRWTPNGGITGLGNSVSGGFFAYAAKVSKDGTVIGGHGFSPSGIQAIRWHNGAGVFLGDLPGGGFQSDVRAVSADGLALAGYSYSGNGVEAFRWTSETGMQPLGDLLGSGFLSDAYGVSDGGAVVVGGGFSAAGNEPFRWENGAMESLGNFPGGAVQGAGLSINADGSVIVGYSHNGMGAEAFRWTRTAGMIGLGDLTGGSFSSSATAVSADGSTIVGHGTTAGGEEAFIWDPGRGIRNLREVLVADFGLAAELTGWVLMSAEGISSDGTAIVGYGRNPSGQIEAWLAVLPCPDGCDCATQLNQKVLPISPINGSGFGGSLAIDGGVMLVGAPGAHSQVGAAYVFRRMGTNWLQEGELPNNGFGGNQFAVSVALSGNTAVIGSPVDNSGTAWVFERINNSWVQTADLHPDVIFGGPNFSRSVAIHGDTIVVGSPRDGDRASEAGAVYVFHRGANGGWVREAKFSGSNTSAGNEFGHSVAIHGETIVVGAILANSLKGAAYIFERQSNGSWIETAQLLGSATQSDANFGNSVAIDGDTAIIGASRESFDDRPGRSYVFVRTQAGAWIEQGRLDSPEPTIGDEFGYRVAVFGDTALVGARWGRCSGSLVGAAYLYTRSANSWSPSKKFIPSSRMEYDGFGWSVALDNSAVAVGAPTDDQLIANNGAVYVLTTAQSCALAVDCPPDLENVPADSSQCFATQVNLGVPNIQTACGSVSVSNDAPSQFPIGETSVNWTIADASGNTLTCVQKVTVKDFQTPFITCPPDITANASDSGSAVVLFTVLATDNCSGVSITSSPPSGSTFLPGTTVVNCSATDLAGNTATCSFTVTVNVAPPAGCATSYDLRADWSTTANPNGVWTYRAGSQVLPAYSWGDSLPAAQPSWQNQSPGALPAWISSAVDAIPGLDWRAGDIVVHTQDDNLGFGRGQANVVWTCPEAGLIDISGGVWMARDIGRGNLWRLFVRGSEVSSGEISSGDAFYRTHPFTFDLGSGGAEALQDIQVAAGDQVMLQLERTSTFGDYVGVEFVVSLAEFAAPAIVGVSVPENSQVEFSRPAYDDVWSVSAPPLPFNVDSGIGIIVNPTVAGGNNNHDFALHQNDGIPSSPRYVAPYVPAPQSVTITYEFNQPVAVTGVEILQHLFGITRVEGFCGDSLDAMTSMGAVFGPAGDVRDNFVVANEADSQVFSFSGNSTARRFFQLVVRKTAHPSAFANYRIYPLDQSGDRILPAAACPLITPRITWPAPADIVFGTPLGAAQLNATANVPGTFSYVPDTGTLLNAGNQQTLSVTFLPTDSSTYASASASITINVLKASPVLSWETPNDLVFGTPLGPEQLNATANVPGTFDFSPPTGTILPVGSHSLSVVFLPTDAANYNNALLSVPLVVFNPDSDGDGLLDAEEISLYGTDPNDPDSDGDGLFDGTEVEMAEGAGCPNPLNADSDGDSLLDGDEVALGTSPCAADTDNDGVPDAEDPLPTTPGVTQDFIEEAARDLASEIDAFSLTLFDGPNANANAGRRNALSNRATEAANAIAVGELGEAIDQLNSLLQKIDGIEPAPDWMAPSPMKTDLAQHVSLLITLLMLL